MRTELNELHDRVGKTSLYVTHDQAEAMTLSDRVVVMSDGNVQQVDSPEVVYERPANRFVAGFIGEPPMNFFDVSAEVTDEGVRVTNEGFDLLLPPEVGERLAAWGGDTSRLELGVRPGAFGDAGLLEGEIDPDRSFEARVMVIEPMGPHKDLAVRPLAREDDEAAEFTARVDNDTVAEVGGTVRLTVELDEVHLFDSETGENLLV
jgi:multiple sugar transport system ATP-binding protein